MDGQIRSAKAMMQRMPPDRPQRVAMLTRYDSNGASSRVRALQFLPLLHDAGLRVDVMPLLSNGYVNELYKGRRAWPEVLNSYWRRLHQCLRLHQYDVVWVEKELMPMLPYGFEAQLLGRSRLVLDLDDAIFHNYDLAKSTLVRKVLGEKIDRLMRRAQLVTVGNSYLAGRAQAAGAQWIEQLPSTVPLSRYPAPDMAARLHRSRPFIVVVWIGSPATVHYLDALRPALQRVAQRFALRLHVIGAQAPTWPGVVGKSIAWSEASEARELADCDIGVMPLADTPWEQGKCSFKLIQYMACGLPVIASPVGMNCDVVQDQINGLLASTEEEWVCALTQLIEDSEKSLTMGTHGRAQVEAIFSVEAVGVRLAKLLRELAQRPSL